MNRIPTIPAAPKNSETVSEDDLAPSRIDVLLDILRHQLGMDVAFLSQFTDGSRVLRNVATSAADAQIQAGMSHPVTETYCNLIAGEEIDAVTSDTSVHPILAGMPVTAELNIGAYIGVPVRRRDGSLYGTLCTYSHQPDPDLRQRDAGALSGLAGLIMELAEDEDRAGQERQHQHQQFTALQAIGGPSIAYQPIRTLDRGEIIGMEALSRFPHGSPSPEVWFRTAHQHGFGVELELLAIANATRVLDNLHGFMALNASPATIVTGEFAALMNSLPLEQMVLEITEHDPIDDYRAIADALEPLRANGLRLAVDDTGAGFASMRHVLQLLPDFIKLDAALTHDIDRHQPSQAFVASMVTFAFKTDAIIIAEGVETDDELRCLRRLGVHCAQGYLLGHPSAVPASRYDDEPLPNWQP